MCGVTSIWCHQMIACFKLGCHDTQYKMEITVGIFFSHFFPLCSAYAKSGLNLIRSLAYWNIPQKLNEQTAVCWTKKITLFVYMRAMHFRTDGFFATLLMEFSLKYRVWPALPYFINTFFFFALAMLLCDIKQLVHINRYALNAQAFSRFEYRNFWLEKEAHHQCIQCACRRKFHENHIKAW